MCVCAWHTSTAQRSGWQATKGQQHEHAGCVSSSPSPSFFISMDMQWQHKSLLLTR